MKFIKKLYTKLHDLILGRTESYLVLCLSERQAENLYERLHDYLQTRYGVLKYLAFMYDHDIIAGTDGHIAKVTFVSIRSSDYISTQVEHKGTTIAWTTVDEFLNEHEEKRDVSHT